METIDILVDVGFLVHPLTEKIKQNKKLSFISDVNFINNTITDILNVSLGASQNTVIIADRLCNARIPRDISQDLVTGFILHTNQAFGNHISSKYPADNYNYSYSIKGCYVTITISDKPKVEKQQALIDEYQLMQDAIDNWDYVPEKTRRRFGL